MTGDAQAEAERIVWDLTRSVERHVSSGMKPVGDERIAKEDRMRAALAAAIEVTDEVHSDWALDAALDDLRDALSALRARAGEG